MIEQFQIRKQPRCWITMFLCMLDNAIPEMKTSVRPGTSTDHVSEEMWADQIYITLY